MKSWIPLLMAFVGLALLPGCFVGIDHHSGGGSVFTVEWTIDGATHGSDCDYYGARSVYITVESHHGTVDDATVSCDRFGYDFDVPPGIYWVTVTMLDSHDNDVSTTIRTDDYDLRGDDGYISADFPPDSFR